VACSPTGNERWAPGATAGAPGDLSSDLHLTVRDSRFGSAYSSTRIAFGSMLPRKSSTSKMESSPARSTVRDPERGLRQDAASPRSQRSSSSSSSDGTRRHRLVPWSRLKLQPRHPGHPDVQDETLRLCSGGELEVFLGEREGLGLYTDRPHQAEERASHRRVVIQNRDQCGLFVIDHVETIALGTPAPLHVGMSSPLAPRKAEPSGHPDEIGEGLGVHLLHHVAAMYLYGDLADPES